MSNLIKTLSQLTIIAMSLFLSNSWAQENGSPFVFEENKDYSQLVSTNIEQASDLSELDTIAEIEVFYWYGCEPCFQVEAALLDFKAQNPQISIRRTPVVLRPQWRSQAYIQAISEQLARPNNDYSILDFYRQCLSDCNAFATVTDSLNWIAQQTQASQAPTVDRDLIWSTEKNYQKRVDLFSISQVPTIIIKESYKIDANQAQTAGRMIEIVNHLLSL